MGAWGAGTFENDTACDWVYKLEECDDLSVITEALATVLECDEDYLDADVASCALAACEVIARLRGQPGVRDAYTEAADQWVAAHQSLRTDAVVKTALQAIDRIVDEDSELLDLWKESDSVGEWKVAVDELRSRLK